MSTQAVLLPLFVQVILTFVMYYWMAYHRITLLNSGAVRPRDVALREPNWPSRVMQIQNAAHNQLELPVLFYALTILSIITRQADMVFVVLAWVFVLSRIGHAYIHVTHNRLQARGGVFGIGLFVLMIMWIIFIVRILASL